MQWGRAAAGMETVGPPSDSKCYSAAANVDNLIWLSIARKNENRSREPKVDEFCAGTCAYHPRLYGDPGPTPDQQCWHQLASALSMCKVCSPDPPRLSPAPHIGLCVWHVGQPQRGPKAPPPRWGRRMRLPGPPTAVSRPHFGSLGAPDSSGGGPKSRTGAPFWT
jgi:hypothetical protein